jgi:type 1 glutamine amidotransferase
LGFTLGLLLCVFSVRATADEPKAIDLFNGKDLAGWSFHQKGTSAKMEEVWGVRDGVLTCTGRPAGYLKTDKEFENYVLTLEWRWPGKGGNNGVLVHTTTPEALGVWPKSIEVQLGHENAGDFWVIGTELDVEDEAARKTDRRHRNTSDGDEKPLGEWNKMEITCRGDEVLVKVNGRLVNHATKCSQTKGAVSLQSEGTPIEFRNIRLTPLAALSGKGKKISSLILDGQNNHDWKKTTPVMRRALEATGLFTVDVATSPPGRDGLEEYRPQFTKYDVVISNYNGQRWSKEAEADLLDYVKNGGGFVVVHAANNSFGDWKEYNEMIGLGGWGGRSERHGPYVYFDDGGKLVRDTAKGPGGHHGPQHAFQIVVRDVDHPITRGMPRAWMHAQDELYDLLRGPAENMHVLATAHADKAKGGSGRHEPMIFTVSYGKGRVFHTPMGHADYSMKCVGFITTLARGAEWAATGEVTQGIPGDFPTADAVSSRDVK